MLSSSAGNVVLMALTCCIMAACSGSGTQSVAPYRPNIIMLTVDTLRADHLNSYGYSRDTMPAIESFAKGAVVFDNAVVPRGTTRPSYASMLTGLYPYQHGVRTNFTRLHEDLTTLSEELHEAGYRTAGFVSNFVLVGELSGMDQGFDIYDDRIEEPEGHRINFERGAAGTLKAILEWLDSSPPEPFFLFTNFIDPHGPYDPPDFLRGTFKSGTTRMLREDQIPDYQRQGDQLDYYDYVDRYDEEIRYVDATLEVLIDELKERGLFDDAVVIFAADHGESMGEHRIFFEHHSQVWEETVRVPMMIRLPPRSGEGRGSAPRRVSELCSPMDLMPTLLALLGLPPGAQTAGRSLLPLWDGRSLGERDFLIEFPSVASPGQDLPDVYAVRSESDKLVRALDPVTGALVAPQVVFNVRVDPLEQSAAPYDESLDEHRRLSDRLDALLGRLHTYELPFVTTEYRLPGSEMKDFVESRSRKTTIKTLTEEQIEKLRSLGYVQ